MAVNVVYVFWSAHHLKRKVRVGLLLARLKCKFRADNLVETDIVLERALNIIGKPVDPLRTNDLSESGRTNALQSIFSLLDRVSYIPWVGRGSFGFIFCAVITGCWGQISSIVVLA